MGPQKRTKLTSGAPSNLVLARGKGKAVAGVVGKYGCEAGFELHGTEEKRG